MATFETMLRRDRRRWGLRFARASWLRGVSVRGYRAPEAGTLKPSFGTYSAICEPFGWLK